MHHAQGAAASRRLGRDGRRGSGALLPTDPAGPQHLQEQKPYVVAQSNSRVASLTLHFTVSFVKKYQ